MNILVRRGFLALGFSTLVALAYVPLGDSGWAEGIRIDATAPRAEPPLAVRVFAPVVKETLLMGIPAVLVVLLAGGIRRLRR